MHIGSNMTVLDEDIIAMIPAEELLASQDTRRAFLEAMGSSRIQPSAGAQKTYIIAKRGERLMVYASPITSVYLAERKE